MQSKVFLPKRHFESLDAMRFFAFFLVFLHHLPAALFPGLVFFQHSGNLAVQFFFTLSGFLITYLILDEKKKTSKLNLQSFFVRRILRIWPLYYLMVLFAFFTPYILNSLGLSFSNEGYNPNWLMSALFLENYKIIIEGQLANVSPLAVMWTVCIEEHFYIIWGVILYFLKGNKTPVLIISCILLVSIFRLIFMSLNWQPLDIITNIDAFAYGAIPAFLLTHKSDFERKISQFPLTLKFTVITVAVLFVITAHLYNQNKYLNELLFPHIHGLLFSAVISFTLPQMNNKIKIGDNNIFSKWGKYTYGLYLFHTIIISLFIQIYNSFNLGLDDNWISISFFMMTLGISLLASMISYHLFEVKFLRLKKYFQPAGGNA